MTANLLTLNSSKTEFEQGVRQGCILSPYLFNLIAELLMRYTLGGFVGCFRIGGRRITNLRYADDIVLIASSEEELQELVSRLHGAASMMGMKINGKKTEVMKVSDDPTPLRVTVAGVPLAETKSFKTQVPGFYVQIRGDM